MNPRIIIPLFCLKNTRAATLKDKFVKTYKIDPQWLYQSYLLVYEFENLIQCIFILISNNPTKPGIHEEVCTFNKYQRELFREYVLMPVNLLSSRELSILEFPKEQMEEENFLDLCTSFIKDE